MPEHISNAGDEAPIILHIGIGSFHRTHQARYLHHLREAAQTDWSIVAATIREDMVPLLECLTRQNGSYTLETVTPDGFRAYERIEAIRRLVPWDVELAALVD
ncbi:MAG: mannitol dehydrogenase family protein, partial [Candidatus Eremiobacteraeota bacterium]|nr:mannitol dehydrogenase family protein [Candidatus Eremiobacteraeota bacterium]